MTEPMTKNQKCNMYHARRIHNGARSVRVILDPPVALALANLLACDYGKDMTAVIGRALVEASDRR